jgi:DNA-binding IclR family transcriptional regulator
MTDGPRYHERGLLRGLEILCAFSTAAPSLSLTELQDRLGIPKSSLVRLLSCLEYMGFVEQDPTTKAYRLGIRALQLGSTYRAVLRIEDVARPFLEELAQQCHQCAGISRLSKGRVVHLADAPPPRPIRFFTPLGTHDPVHCTAAGKVLVAGLPVAELGQILATHPLVALTPRTIVREDEFLAHLALVRLRGYARDDEETAIGLSCVAVPICAPDSRVVAALTISGPTGEFTHEAVDRFVELLRAAADGIATRLFGTSPASLGDAVEQVGT